MALLFCRHIRLVVIEAVVLLSYPPAIMTGIIDDSLVGAIVEEDVRRAVALISSGVDVNKVGNNGHTPLSAAITVFGNRGTRSPSRIARSRVRIVRLLIRAGADVHYSGHGLPLLHSAVDLHQPKIVKLLLDAGSDVSERNLHNKTPLEISTIYRQMEVVRHLLDAGAGLSDTSSDESSSDESSSDESSSDGH